MFSETLSSVKTPIILILALSTFSSCAGLRPAWLLGPTAAQKEATWRETEAKFEADRIRNRSRLKAIYKENPSWKKAVSDDVLVIECKDEPSSATTRICTGR